MSCPPSDGNEKRRREMPDVGASTRETQTSREASQEEHQGNANCSDDRVELPNRSRCD